MSFIFFIAMFEAIFSDAAINPPPSHKDDNDDDDEKEDDDNDDDEGEDDDEHDDEDNGDGDGDGDDEHNTQPPPVTQGRRQRGRRRQRFCFFMRGGELYCFFIL